MRKRYNLVDGVSRHTVQVPFFDLLLFFVIFTVVYLFSRHTVHAKKSCQEELFLDTTNIALENGKSFPATP